MCSFFFSFIRHIRVGMGGEVGAWLWTGDKDVNVCFEGEEKRWCMLDLDGRCGWLCGWLC